MNGNRWVGPGHNSVITDSAGQDWFVYHAIDRNDPYFAGAVGFTKRPALLDRLDWIDGWPTVRAGRWASSSPQASPVVGRKDDDKNKKKDEEREKEDRKQRKLPFDEPGKLLSDFSDEFDGTSLTPRWSWVRQPAPETIGVANGLFRFDTQAADLYVDSNNASVLLGNTPKHDYLVETRVQLNLPPEGCCYNYVQAGLVIYGSDDNFIKLTHVSIWETRQTEFAKELFPVPAGYPRYGNTVAGVPNEWTYLRIARHADKGEERFTAYTSNDGTTWVRGGTWTHQLGDGARVGLVSMGGSGFTANFDYVRVYRLNSSERDDEDR